jgi:hypothetical protein
MKRERTPERHKDMRREDIVRVCVMSTSLPAPALTVILYGNKLREKAIFRRIESETTVRQNMGRILWCLASRHGGDGENPGAMLIQGDDVRGKIART